MRLTYQTNGKMRNLINKFLEWWNKPSEIQTLLKEIEESKQQTAIIQKRIDQYNETHTSGHNSYDNKGVFNLLRVLH